jgi:hypothetical protein
VDRIVPHVRAGHSRMECYKEQPSIWNVLRKPLYDGTIIHMSGYVNHLVDPVYVKTEHKKINGLLQEWKRVHEEAISDLQIDWQFSYEAIKDQLNWINSRVELMQEGLTKFSLMPVSHLNHTAVRKLVEGVNTEEEADLIINLGKSVNIEVGIVRDDDRNNVSIVTIFDQDNARKVAYGKKSVEDLTMKPRALSFE